MSTNEANNEHLGGQFADLDKKRASQQRRFFARRPKRIDNILAQVVQRRGYAQVRVAGERDEAWNAAVGELAAATQIGGLRRGTLEVRVENSLLMQELTFRKEELIKKLQTAMPDAGIKQLRFRVGHIQ